MSMQFFRELWTPKPNRSRPFGTRLMEIGGECSATAGETFGKSPLD